MRQKYKKKSALPTSRADFLVCLVILIYNEDVILVGYKNFIQIFAFLYTFLHFLCNLLKLSYLTNV